jgi:YVTN family beta-propeller protein
MTGRFASVAVGALQRICFRRRQACWNRTAVFTVLLGLACLPTHAQTVTATVPTDQSPSPVVMNPVTNKIYVGNYTAGTVQVIDGASNTIVADLAVGGNPYHFAVNPLTNKIYVADASSASSAVTVIDGASNNLTTVTVGSGQHFSIAVNPGDKQDLREQCQRQQRDRD